VQRVSRLFDAMPLRYQPRPGDIFMCAFPECFDVPEMVKTRPGHRSQSAVAGPPRPGVRGSDLTLGSGTNVRAPLRRASADAAEVHASDRGDRWAKCDMLYTFSTRRLSPVEHGRRDARGKRGYEYPKVDRATLDIVRRAVASSLGIDTSLWSLAKAETRAPKAMA
jgi:uncharacterized protein YifN (PemK superfamily)